MRRTTAPSALVLVAFALSIADARAQDAQPGPRGTLVLPVGDKIHGYLRGGETHALEVHLAAGDVYSFAVTSKKLGDPLVLQLALFDPDGRELNAEARVLHRGGGKRVTVGPFRALTTGTYTIELRGQSWFEGDYWGTSKVRRVQRATYSLPDTGAEIEVPVAAGSTLRLASVRNVDRLVMALPGEAARSFASDDPLVVALRSVGLTTSETGTFRFAAVAGHARAAITVDRPRWHSEVVEVHTLPDDPSRRPLEWILGWTGLTTQAAVEPPRVGAVAPLTADASPSLFVSDDIGTSLDWFVQAAPVGTAANPQPLPGQHAEPDVPDPSSPAPPVIVQTIGPPPESTPFTGFTGGGHVRIAASAWAGTSMFMSDRLGLYRYTPWQALKGISSLPQDTPFLPYTPAVYAVPSPETTDSDETGSYVVRTFTVGSTWGLDPDVRGTITTTTRYMVDGHSVARLLATKGSYTITWTVTGSGTIGETPWTLAGTWTQGIVYAAPGSMTGDLHWVRAACTVSGHEQYQAGDVTERIEVPGLTDYVSDCDVMDMSGQVVDSIEIAGAGIRQTVVRDILPTDPVTGAKSLVFSTTEGNGDTHPPVTVTFPFFTSQIMALIARRR